MAKFKIQKGDKINARSPMLRDENTYKPIGGHNQYEKPLTVKKVYPHGVTTKELGYVHNNNILSKVEEPEDDEDSEDVPCCYLYYNKTL